MVYGHGQQRRAVIEAIRLSENGKKKSNYKLQQADEVSGVSSPQYFKDESKKWLKYVTKVSGQFSYLTFSYVHSIGTECVASKLLFSSPSVQVDE